jgi:hypothetical protein
MVSSITFSPTNGILSRLPPAMAPPAAGNIKNQPQHEREQHHSDNRGQGDDDVTVKQNHLENGDRGWRQA